MNRKLTIYRGLPGTGKTTAAREHVFERRCPLIEEDDFFMDPYHGYMFDNAFRDMALSYTLTRAAKALFDGHHEVIVTAVMPLRSDVVKYKKLVLDLFPDVELEVITKRGMYESVHDVPADHMSMMCSIFEEVE